MKNSCLFYFSILFLFSAKSLFSQNTTHHQLDSIIYYFWDPILTEWVNDSKILFTYDPKGNSVQDLSMSFDKINKKWVNSSKSEYDFNGMGNLKLKIDFRWDEFKKNWFGSSKEEHLPDTIGNNIQSFYYYGNYDGWKGILKIINLYDSIGRINTSYIYEWNEQANTWNDYFETEVYKYDSKGNLSKEIRHVFLNEDGYSKNNLMFEYVYDQFNYKLQKVTSYRDESTNQWKNAIKNEYIYDANFNVIKEIYYKWNEHNNQWDEYQIDDFIYNAYNKLLEHSGIFLYNSHTWLPIIDKVMNTYDVTGNLTKTIYLKRKELTNQVVPIYKEEYLVDDSFSTSNVLFPYIFQQFSSDNFIHKVIENTSFNWEESVSLWTIEEKKILYYSGKDVTSSKIVEKTIDVYPNPTSRYLIYKHQPDAKLVYEVYSMDGRLLLQNSYNEENKIDLGAINDGLYVLKIVSGGNVHTHKILKQQ